MAGVELDWVSDVFAIFQPIEVRLTTMKLTQHIALNRRKLVCLVIQMISVAALQGTPAAQAA
eukprot:SAG11_NODE_8025_length_1068_cov_1.395253_1_plen_61_part_10